MKKLISCEYNFDNCCVELKFTDGSMIAIDTIAVENEVARNMYERSDLDYLIEKIFDLAFHGAGAAKIARVLVEEKVPTAGWLNYQRYGTFAHIYEDAPEEKAYAWTLAQIKSILKDETYIGNSVHNKQTNISYKNKKKVRKPQEEWFRVEHTHEAIISKEVFEQVQKQIASRRRQQKDATTQIFSGLVKCADCGWSMRFGTNNQNKNPYSHYTCSQYGQGLKQCSAHYIRYDYLYTYVLTRIHSIETYSSFPSFATVVVLIPASSLKSVRLSFLSIRSFHNLL